MKKTNQLLALLTALLVAVSMFGVTVRAEAADTYVLNYNGAYDGAKWQYFSPYMPAWTYDGSADCNNTIAFTLYDTRNGNGFPVYCTDVAVGLDNDSDFRRINLEDSSYAGFAAGKLRSVYLNGFPCTDLAELSSAAGVEALTVGEAVAATQLAIWNIAHADQMTVTDFCRSIDTRWDPNGVTEHYAECFEEIKSGYASAENAARIEQRIERVFRYLMNLKPTAPTGAVASCQSFRSWDARVEDNGDGKCNVTAVAVVDVILEEGDALTLTAQVGGYTAAADLQNGEQTYTLTIENVPADIARGAITLAIDGVQSLGDVYLFDADGERGESQSLIGWTENALPVHAQVNANDRILNVFKTAGGVGLQNIFFDIYRVCSVGEYVNGQVVLGTGVVEIDGAEHFSAPTEADVAKYVKGLPFATIATDASGCASFNFGNGNDGIYIVAERENPLTTGAIHPFFVAIPGGSNASATEDYEITVEPKNTLIGEDVEIGKDVEEIGRDHGTFGVGETHTWIIQATIPAGMSTGLCYEITDTLSDQLTFAGNVQVSVAEKDAPDILEELIAQEDYVLTVSENAFTVALNSSGMAKAAAVEGEVPVIRVCFDAYINENAILGSEIHNQAHIRYENNVGVDFDRDSDLPEVHTGGLSLVKVDASNRQKRLAGAKFTLNVQNEDGTYAPVAFYADAAMTRKVEEVSTDENGCALFYGLAYGTYYLIETEAPDGYSRLTEPVEVVINEAAHLEANAVLVTNSARFRLPETGGMGTMVFTLGGAGILGAAALVLLGGKKRR